jgi:hypothetical protein
MFKQPSDLAKAALNLLELIDSVGEDKIGILELAAAIMASAVLDWHCFHKRMRKSAGHAEFARDYPEFRLLQEMANGTKHPVQRQADIGASQRRELEWEDRDFWNASPHKPTLFIDVDGEQRSVRALVWGFCHPYLAKTGSSS